MANAHSKFQGFAVYSLPQLSEVGTVLIATLLIRRRRHGKDKELEESVLETCHVTESTLSCSVTHHHLQQHRMAPLIPPLRKGMEFPGTVLIIP